MTSQPQSQNLSLEDLAKALPASDAEGWVLYDGSCGICQRLVSRGEWLLTRRKLRVAPLQAPWVNEIYQLPEEELMRDVRLLLIDGTRIHAADVYRFVARRTWWLWPLWLLSVIPGFSHLVDWSYRKFADNRHRFSSTCKLQ